MADAGLATWVKEHRYLVPSAVETGESGVALLLLWEVDHRQPYPSGGGDGLSGALLGFSKRLQDRVLKDADLCGWLVWKDMAVPLCAGLAPSHHRRWAVRLMAPGRDEPQGWYRDFLSRWKAYLETMARPRGSRPTTGVTVAQAALIQPQPLLDTMDEATSEEAVALLSGSAQQDSGAVPLEEDEVAPPAKRRRPSAAARVPRQPAPSSKRSAPAPTADGAPPQRKQRTLTTWVSNRTDIDRPLPPTPDSHSPLPRQHGRAAAGPPT